MATVRKNYNSGFHDVGYIDGMLSEDIKKRPWDDDSKSDPGPKHSVPDLNYFGMRCERHENVSDWSFNDMNHSFPGLNA